ncbi:unnamed protein product, partial [Rotaria sp. Silwood2]
MPNNQSVNHLSPARVIMHHETQQQRQQQLFSSHNVTPNMHPSVLHSNTNHQQAVLTTCQPSIMMTEMPTSSLTNPTISSTPIST